MKGHDVIAVMGGHQIAVQYATTGCIQFKSIKVRLDVFWIVAKELPAKPPVMAQGPHIGTAHGEERPFAARPQQLLANIGLQLGGQASATIFGEQINQLHIAGLGFIGKAAKFQLTHQLSTRPDMEVMSLRLPQPFADPLPIAVDKVGKAVMGMKAAKIGIPARS